MVSNLLQRFKESSVAQIFFLSLTVFIFYFGLWNSYFWGSDDFYWRALMRQRHTLLEAAQGVGNGVRFLWFPFVWMLDRLFINNATPYYWLGLIQHVLITGILYWLLFLWTKRKGLAFLTALLFATRFSYFEILTSTSASGYLFWALFYMISFTLFVLYLDQRKSLLYWSSVVVYALLAAGNNYALSMPLILLAYQLTLGLGSRTIRSLKWADFKLHVPYWIIWGIHVSGQLYYVFQGTSEAAAAGIAYGPGLHMLSNFFYLIFLVIPNVHMDSIFNTLSGYISSTLIEMIWQFTIGLAIAGLILAIISIWKGKALVRFSIALIIIPFLQYLMWEGNWAGASRYLYFPAMGFSILLSVYLIKLHNYLVSKGKLVYRLVVPTVVTAFLVSSLIFIQVRVQKDIENAKIRRPFVTQLASNYRDIEPGSTILIEVPDLFFTDLKDACFSVFGNKVKCKSFIRGERSLNEIDNNDFEKPVYWLQATENGLLQLFPPIQ